MNLESWTPYDIARRMSIALGTLIAVTIWGTVTFDQGKGAWEGLLLGLPTGLVCGLVIFGGWALYLRSHEQNR
ncbi:hypothetical protein HNR42_003439 [Deinobacterium chartae]|uniref:DUF2530 domain-containing protein n=1 Tax=Deinobacterium chartae TaxID=521158 RepID=A0A841I673_9DEIO|nr:hypothetical protein [Deinobacterium chartae]MBB6099978.1 hypothetical protein [Deinobacterium chartae]